MVKYINQVYVDIILQLQFFKQDKYDFDELQDGKANELNVLTRNVKKEVIDIADQADQIANQMEERSQIINILKQKLLSQDTKINGIYEMLHKMVIK